MTTRFRPHTRDAVVDAARGWLGTPYHHQASLRGIGSDCLGLVRGIFRELYGFEPEHLPPYSRDWAEATGEETMLTGARRHLVEIAPGAARAGDILVFRLKPGVVAKHAAIQSSDTSMIHAAETTRTVEVALTPWWRRRIAGAFSFPGSID